MNFSPNKTPIEVIKEGPFGGTYFRDKFVHLKNSDANDVNVNKYGVKCGTSLRLWENKGSINEIDPYGWFQWYFRYCLGRISKDDKRKINRWKKTLSRFSGKLVKAIRDVGSKFDDYSIFSKIRQNLLHWGYKLTEKDFFNELTN